MRVVPDGAILSAMSRVGFRVTAEMVADFAELTGDRSSQHVSESFARRSAYRRRVVHGMLPVGFLPLLGPLRVAGLRCVPLAISAQFFAPVFADDELTLVAEPGRAGSTEGEFVFDFQIAQDASRTTVTAGAVTVAYRRESEHRDPHATGSGGAMLTRPVEVSTFRLEQIEKGLKDRLDFRISAETIHLFAALLRRGAGERADEPLDTLMARFHVPSLLSVLLFSTSVGVSLPGSSATFLEFSARIEKDVPLDTPFSLMGEVVHRSLATRIIKKEVLICGAGQPDDVVVRGRVASLVSAPPRRMPSMGELKAAGTDWGLNGKVVLVTGASRGIGETTAKLLAVHGARVIVNYHRGAEDGARVVREIGEAGGEAVALAADVTSPEAVESLVAAATQRFGAIQILVNNAARDYRPIPFVQLTWDDIQRDLDVIAKGAFLCCRQVIPQMLESGGGKIVNIGSLATENPWPPHTNYVMAKSALVGLTRSLAVEFAARNIQVNMVVPTFVETDLVAHIQEGFRNKIAHETPMQRHASPAEVANAVLFLASSLSSFTTGQKIMVTGGGAPYL